MAGFRIPRRVAILEFDGEYAGAEIRARLDVDTETYFAISRLQGEVDGPNEAENLRQALGFFVDHIAIGWNLEDEDGTAIPMTVDGLMRLPWALTAALIPKWREAVTTVAAPLDDASPDTGLSVVE